MTYFLNAKFIRYVQTSTGLSLKSFSVYCSTLSACGLWSSMSGLLSDWRPIISLKRSKKPPGWLGSWCVCLGRSSTTLVWFFFLVDDNENPLPFGVTIYKLLSNIFLSSSMSSKFSSARTCSSGEFSFMSLKFSSGLRSKSRGPFTGP